MDGHSVGCVLAVTDGTGDGKSDDDNVGSKDLTCEALGIELGYASKSDGDITVGKKVESKVGMENNDVG